MAILVYDHAALVEPNLLLPNRAPIGSVKLDRSNEFAGNSLRLNYLFQHNVKDLSGNGNHGTLSAGNTYVVGDRKIAVDSRGPTDDDVITIPSIAALRRDGMVESYTWIFRVKANGVDERAGIWQNGQGSGSAGHYVYFEGTTGVRFSVDAWNAAYASASITATTWNWVAATYNSVTDKVNVFVNGVIGTEATNSSPSINADETVLSAVFYPTFDRQLDGQIAFASFYDVCLTAAEIARYTRDPYQIYKAAG